MKWTIKKLITNIMIGNRITLVLLGKSSDVSNAIKQVLQGVNELIRNSWI